MVSASPRHELEPAVPRILRRLAHSSESGADPDEPVRSAAARRTDEPPRPRCDALARGPSEPLLRHLVGDRSRSRISRCGGRSHRASGIRPGNPLSRQLQLVRASTRRQSRAPGDIWRVVRRAKAEEIMRFVDRFRAKSSKARQVQSRLKALERLADRRARPRRFAIRVQLPESGADVADADPSWRMRRSATTARPIVAVESLRIAPGSRIGVLGANGAGKTTLMRTLAGDLPLLSGDLFRGQHSSVGYFAQHQLELLQRRPERAGTTPPAHAGRHGSAAAHLSRRLGIRGRHGDAPDPHRYREAKRRDWCSR